MAKLKLGGNLWHHRDFSRLWLSDTVSQFGNQFTQFALPVLAILSFNATPFELGILGALAFLSSSWTLRWCLGRSVPTSSNHDHLQLWTNGCARVDSTGFFVPRA